MGSGTIRLISRQGHAGVPTVVRYDWPHPLGE